MSDLDNILAFVEGAQTALDTMDSSQGGKHERSEFWRGYRHALDSVSGQIDEIKSMAIEASIR